MSNFFKKLFNKNVSKESQPMILNTEGAGTKNEHLWYAYNDRISHLKEWKDRYSMSEYPSKVAINTVYQMLTIEGFWTQILNCFNNEKKYNSNKEAFDAIQKLSGNYATQNIHNNVLTSYQTLPSINILDLNVLRTIVNSCKTDKSKIKEVEKIYLWYTGAIELIYSASAYGLQGYKMADSFYSLCSVMIGGDLRILENSLKLLGTNIMMCYKESDTNSKIFKMNDSKQKFDILTFYDEVMHCQNIETILVVYEKYKNYYDPDVEFYIASTYFNIGLKENSRIYFINAVKYYFRNLTEFWDSYSTETIGQSLFFLLNDLDLKVSDQTKYKLYKISLLCFGRYIEQNKEASLPYIFRGTLLQNFDSTYTNMLMNDVFALPIFIPEIFFLSDYYTASLNLKKENKNDYQEYYSRADDLHKELEDITVDGRDANEYSLQQISEIGSQRHQYVYEFLKKEYLENQLTLNENQLDEDINKILTLTNTKEALERILICKNKLSYQNPDYRMFVRDKQARETINSCKNLLDEIILKINFKEDEIDLNINDENRRYKPYPPLERVIYNYERLKEIEADINSLITYFELNISELKGQLILIQNSIREIIKNTVLIINDHLDSYTGSNLIKVKKIIETESY